MVNVKVPSKFASIIKKDIELVVSLNIAQINEISLFGSCSRGECRYNSDIDLIIITKGNKLDKSLTGFIRGELEYVDDTGVVTDVVFYDIDIFNSSKERIVSNIRRDKIVLWKEGVYTNEYKELL